MKKYVVFDIETTGLKPWYDNIVTCICAKAVAPGIPAEYFREYKTHDSAESKLINSFLTWMHKFHEDGYKLISKNGVGFDIPFILTRYCKQVSTKDFPHFLQQMEHFDLHTITKKWISLQDMAIILGCKQKSDKGINAIKMYLDGEYEKLLKYCADDVEVTEEVYLLHRRLKNEASNINI